jgi:heme/copper-type cytochrome/quinol oxidase subunit 2
VRQRSPILFWSLAGIVVLAASALFLSPYLRGAGTAADVVLRISMAGWDNPVVQAEAGKPVRITMVNLDTPYHLDGGGWHNFVVEELNIHERVGPKGVVTFSLVAEEPGDYLFYCDICCGGKENPFMQGRLLVT